MNLFSNIIINNYQSSLSDISISSALGQEQTKSIALKGVCLPPESGLKFTDLKFAFLTSALRIKADIMT